MEDWEARFCFTWRLSLSKEDGSSHDLCHSKQALKNMPCFHCNFLSQMCQMLFFTLLLHIYESEKECTHIHAHAQSCSHKTSLALAHTVLSSPGMYLVRAGESGKKKIVAVTMSGFPNTCTRVSWYFCRHLHQRYSCHSAHTRPQPSFDRDSILISFSLT